MCKTAIADDSRRVGLVNQDNQAWSFERALQASRGHTRLRNRSWNFRYSFSRRECYRCWVGCDPGSSGNGEFICREEAAYYRAVSKYYTHSTIITRGTWPGNLSRTAQNNRCGPNITASCGRMRQGRLRAYISPRNLCWGHRNPG